MSVIVYQVYSNDEFDLWPVYSGERFRAFRPSCFILNFMKFHSGVTELWKISAFKRSSKYREVSLNASITPTSFIQFSLSTTFILNQLLN